MSRRLLVILLNFTFQTKSIVILGVIQVSLLSIFTRTPIKILGSSYSTTTCCPIIKWEDKCQMERSIGEGEDLIPRWYYDSHAGQCKRFLYKGTFFAL